MVLILFGINSNSHSNEEVTGNKYEVLFYLMNLFSVPPIIIDGARHTIVIRLLQSGVTRHVAIIL